MLEAAPLVLRFAADGRRGTFGVQLLTTITTEVPMETRPTKGCCGTCAWLAKTVPHQGSDHKRPMYAIYDETEDYYRQHPANDFPFVPERFNAQMQGRLACFRRVTDLSAESSDGARWSEVIWSDRRCPKWSRYEPGIAPREYLAEERSQRFTMDLDKVATRLTLIAIFVTVVLGILQLLLITPDSFGCHLLKGKVSWCGVK